MNVATVRATTRLVLAMILRELGATAMAVSMVIRCSARRMVVALTLLVAATLPETAQRRRAQTTMLVETRSMEAAGVVRSSSELKNTRS